MLMTRAWTQVGWEAEGGGADATDTAGGIVWLSELREEDKAKRWMRVNGAPRWAMGTPGPGVGWGSRRSQPAEAVFLLLLPSRLSPPPVPFALV